MRANDLQACWVVLGLLHVTNSLMITMYHIETRLVSFICKQTSQFLVEHAIVCLSRVCF